MAVCPILRMGDPRLQQACSPITEFNAPFLDGLIDDLKDTMQAANGAGLAAPQIGILKRVVIFGVTQTPRYPEVDAVPFTILINPEIEVLSDEVEYNWEGCLSIPGMRGLVKRPLHIRYKGFTPTGGPIEREVTGFHAIVVQHECDHLDGILYPMRMEDMSRFGFDEELAPSIESTEAS